MAGDARVHQGGVRSDDAAGRVDVGPADLVRTHLQHHKSNGEGTGRVLETQESKRKLCPCISMRSYLQPEEVQGVTRPAVRVLAVAAAHAIALAAEVPDDVRDDDLAGAVRRGEGCDVEVSGDGGGLHVDAGLDAEAVAVGHVDVVCEGGSAASKGISFWQNGSGSARRGSVLSLGANL